MIMISLKCPNGCCEMPRTEIRRTVEFRDETLDVTVPVCKCPDCGVEACTMDQTEEIQKTIHDAYRRKKGLLTCEEIRLARKKRGWTQDDLAEKARVGIASVKRWELGRIQSRSMDNLIRGVLDGSMSPDVFSGNREFSLERTKLVFQAFEAALSRKILTPGDDGVKTAKYIWYADMAAFRELGQSMTGAAYACLPTGPQLDNYAQLLELIRASNEAQAPGLSPEEKRIINTIANRFPTDKSVFDAALEEPVWTEAKTGCKIPYNQAHRLINA